MTLKHDGNGRQRVSSVLILAGLALTVFAPLANAQTQIAEAKPLDERPAEWKPSPETYQTFYLTNVTQQNDANDIQTDLRNMLPKAKIYYAPSQGALSIRATPEDMQLAQKMIADIDRPKKTYRLTYTITETDDGKKVGVQHFTLDVVAGGKATLKEGSRVPIVTGSYEAGGSTPNTQVQYVDLGLNVEASVDGFADGLRLRTKVEQSKLADEKSGMGAQDPVIRQTTLEGTSMLAQGKTFSVGSLDIPGSTRRQEIEVVSELAK